MSTSVLIALVVGWYGLGIGLGVFAHFVRVGRGSR